ncbi:MAG: Ribonuclease H [bacterium ADurb.Bin157]|jgi:ribonuclease HI|nr:ribonuclease HI [Candidatus Riflebacteria bacterium]NCB47961.1 ribonuclease HI [bacterium]OQB49549.1 MAG: Ribonuclease H [bacterium ADurb.Bin157]
MSLNSKRKSIQLFSDGACSGNPGPGGWGAILRYKNSEKELSGGEKETTNNRMELLGVISALETLKEPCDVEICTDSKYVVDAFEKKWLESWQVNGWKTAGKKPVKNRELWERLLKQASIHNLSWKWIRGHAGHTENERCDRIAVEARENIIK